MGSRIRFLIGTDIIDIEWPSSALFHVTVVEDRPIMSAQYRLPVIFGQNWRTQQLHGLFATAELLVWSCDLDLDPMTVTYQFHTAALKFCSRLASRWNSYMMMMIIIIRIPWTCTMRPKTNFLRHTSWHSKVISASFRQVCHGHYRQTNRQMRHQSHNHAASRVMMTLMLMVRSILNVILELAP